MKQIPMTELKPGDIFAFEYGSGRESFKVEDVTNTHVFASRQYDNRKHIPVKKYAISGYVYFLR